MRQLLIATGNKGKLVEIKAYLEGMDFEVVGLKELYPDGIEVEEPAMTFEGNAIIKAVMVGDHSGCLTLADDAGLEVDALGGLPGVMSARYAPGTDEDRYRKLLDNLKDVPAEKRSARFRAVIAIYDPKSGKIRTCSGSCEGLILDAPRGDKGFGYDPVFFHPPLNKSEAEMTVEEKNSISHRGQALKKAREILLSEFC